MTGESLLRRKWWHSTMYVTNNNDPPEILSTYSTYRIGNAHQNAVPLNIFAYKETESDGSLNYVPSNIPVPSYEDDAAPGVFVHRPSVLQLFASYFTPSNKEDVNNAANKRIFYHVVNAAYSCANDICVQTNFPDNDKFDSIEYFPQIESNKSLVCVFPVLPFFINKNCCTTNLQSPTVLRPRNYDQTFLFLLTVEELPAGVYRYRIYEYDYAISSTPDAYSLMGTLETTVQIFDITLGSGTDEAFFAVTSLGFARVKFSLDVYNDRPNIKKFSLTHFNIQYTNNWFTSDTEWYLLNREGLFSNAPCKIEFSSRTGKFYLFATPKIHTGTVTNPNTGLPSPASEVLTPSIFECTIQDQLLTVGSNRNSGEIPFPFTNPFLASNDQGTSAARFFGIYNNNLVRFNPSTNEAVLYVARNNIFTNINNLAFVKSPDENIPQNVLLGTNSLGQILRININDATITPLPDDLPYEVLGAASTIGVTDLQLRQSILPFVIDVSKRHWLFAIDNNIATNLEVSNTIKPTFVNFLNNYLRAGDKITFIFYGVYNSEQRNIQKTFEIRTISDIASIVNFLATEYTADVQIPNFQTFLSALAVDFRTSDVDSIFFLGKSSYYRSEQNEIREDIQTSLRLLADGNASRKFMFVQINNFGQTGTTQDIYDIFRINLNYSNRVFNYNWII